jgi:hypothetical protein
LSKETAKLLIDQFQFVDTAHRIDHLACHTENRTEVGKLGVSKPPTIRPQ